jgi:hypothetical protein
MNSWFALGIKNGPKSENYFFFVSVVLASQMTGMWSVSELVCNILSHAKFSASINHVIQHSTTRIHLESSVSVLCLRNLNSPTLCTGTRSVVERLCNIARVTTCHAQGKEVLIRTIPIIPSDYPFKFKIALFPLILTCAISINQF